MTKKPFDTLKILDGKHISIVMCVVSVSWSICQNMES